MDPGVGLQAAAGLVNFLVKTTVEWSICLLIVRIALSPAIRFNLWLTMLLGFLAQWIWMCAGVAHALFPAGAYPGFRIAGGASAVGGQRIPVAAATAGALSQVVAGLLVCYVAVIAWRTVGTLAARLRLARAMRHKSAPGQRLAAAFREVVEQQTAPQGCELWVLPGLSSPATLGWLRPRVIVPPACLTQDQAELKAVFWHELKHVERRDALWNAIVRTCRNLMWFHPCVNHAVTALNAQRELACDAAVVREHPHSRDIYASCLVRFARRFDSHLEPVNPTIEMASSAELLTARVRSILSEAQGSSRVSRAWRTTASMLLVGGMAGTVPALNILFAAERISPPMQLSSGVDAHAQARTHSLQHGSAKSLRPQIPASLPAAGAADAPEFVSMARQHDEALAAEHQAAMGVLTESTGMDAPVVPGDGRANSGWSSSGPDHASPVRPSPSWTSAAVEAAARMGPLTGGNDDHH